MLPPVALPPRPRRSAETEASPLLPFDQPDVSPVPRQTHVRQYAMPELVGSRRPAPSACALAPNICKQSNEAVTGSFPPTAHDEG